MSSTDTDVREHGREGDMASPQEALRRALSMGLSAELVSAPSGLPIREHARIENSPGQVIIDATTLFAAGRTIPVILERDLRHAQRSCTKAEIDGTLSLIQSLVIHDRVWVDALTFARSENSSSVASQLSPFINGFIVTDRELYNRVCADVYALRGKLFTESISNHEVELVSVEHLDRHYQHPRDVIFPPADCRKSDIIIFVYDGGRRHALMEEIPRELADSNSGIARTFFYLTLAADLDHPYIPHPERSLLISRLCSESGPDQPMDNVAERVVKHFDSMVLEELRKRSHRFRFQSGIPPIALHVLQRCKKESDLIPAIEEARKQASEFRSWCMELEDAYRSGRPGVEKIQRMEGLLDEALSKWKSGVGEGVKYETREISFPVLEKFVKIDRDWKIKDRVLWSRYKPLLFLNSLYRYS
jgi:hypothetical protein